MLSLFNVEPVFIGQGRGFSLSDFDFDLFVIGGGSGGVRACRVAASLGARVAVAEERYFGGTCVNVGCVPKKLFSYAAHYRDDLEDSRGFGWSYTNPVFNWEILLKNKDKEINRLNGIYKTILNDNNVQIFETRARLQGPNTVLVGEQTVSAKHILLGTGGWPWIPPFEGNELVMNSNDLSLKTVITTGMSLPCCSCVLALKRLQNSMMLTPLAPRAGPTGGAGFACPPLTCNFICIAGRIYRRAHGSS